METEKKKRLELLAPAGDLEKLKIAVLYGADAGYIGGVCGQRQKTLLRRIWRRALRLHMRMV